MFGFGEFRTCLGVVFSDVFGISLRFLVGFLEKWTKRENSGQLRGSFATAKRSLVGTKVLAAARDPLAAARPRAKVGPTSDSPRRSHCSQHENVVFLFRFFFRCSEDLSIGLIRII